MEKALPSVSFPLPIKKLLLTYFNEIPRTSPEDAVRNLRGHVDYPQDVFVEYVVTAGRVKGYFSRFKKHKDDKKLGRNTPCPVEACGGVAASKYTDPASGKTLSNVPDLAREVMRRGILGLSFGRIKEVHKRPALVAMLLEDDEGTQLGDGENGREEAEALDLGIMINNLGDIEEDDGPDNEDADYIELIREENVDEIEIMAELAGAGE